MEVLNCKAACCLQIEMKSGSKIQEWISKRKGIVAGHNLLSSIFWRLQLLGVVQA